MWPSLWELVASIVLIAIAGTATFGGMSVISRGDITLQQQTYGTALLNSLMQSVTRDGYVVYPTSSGYPTQGTGISNPKNYAASIDVLNYEASKTPDFSASYPDSGLQEVIAKVRLPDGATLSATTYKTR